MPKVVKKATKKGSRSSRGSRGSRTSKGWKLLHGITDHIAKYIALSDSLVLVIAVWVIASHLSDIWDRFPHLGITSAEKRCGKTRLLQILEDLLLGPINAASMSAATVFRFIKIQQEEGITILLDEAQQLSGNNDNAQALNEIFCAGIDPNAAIYRCVGKEHAPRAFPIYCPKVIAAIGILNAVLLDRCLPIRMVRKTVGEPVERYRSRIVKPAGERLYEQIEEWTEENREKIQEVYDVLEPFPIENDRLAELLLPLQAILEFIEDEDALAALEGYAIEIDQEDVDNQSIGIKLLSACKEILNGDEFMGSKRFNKRTSKERRRRLEDYSLG